MEHEPKPAKKRSGSWPVFGEIFGAAINITSSLVSGRTNSVASSTAIETAVREAYVMIRFAAEHKRKLELDTIKAIVKLRNRVTASSKSTPDVPTATPTDEDETNFWDAYGKIAEAIAPATVESILLTRGLCEDLNSRNKIQSDASRKVRFFKRSAFFVFAVILPIQAYWFIGQQIMANLNEAEKTISRVGGTEANPPTPAIPADGGMEPKDSLPPAHAQIVLDASNLNIKYWNRVWAAPVPFVKFSFEQAEYDTLRPSLQAMVEQTAAETALKTISGLVLPLLFALLGSIVFVLRRISHHIENNDLSHSTLARMSSRLLMGMISGVAISWLVMPDPSQEITEILRPLTILGPWMSAFVAGYSVEILFAFLDTVITAFVKKSVSA